jgi:hypothetical protein
VVVVGKLKDIKHCDSLNRYLEIEEASNVISTEDSSDLDFVSLV